MMNNPKNHQQLIEQHFSERAANYNKAASWVDSEDLKKIHLDLFPKISVDKLLDIATGTGVLLKWFVDKSKFSVGIDIVFEMLKKMPDGVFSTCQATADFLPFEDNAFDIVSCRQGLHYMDLNLAIPELTRIAQRYVLVSQIVSASKQDVEWWSKIFQVKQPLRKNIFTANGITRTLTQHGLYPLRHHTYFERVRLADWFTYGEMGNENYNKVFALFHNASPYHKKVNRIFFDKDSCFYSNRWFIALFEKK